MYYGVHISLQGSELIRILKTRNNPELQTAIIKSIVTTKIKPKSETIKTLDLVLLQVSHVTIIIKADIRWQIW